MGRVTVEWGVGESALLIELRNGKWASSEHVLLQIFCTLSSILRACACYLCFVSMLSV